MRALDSLERQSLPFSKCILVDDWSEEPIEKESLPLYSNFTLVVYRNHGQGLASARNTGISNSTSKFLAFLDADDFWDTKKLETQVQILTDSVDAVAIVTGCSLVDENEKIIRMLTPLKERGTLSDILDGSFLISGSASSVLLRRDVLGATGFFNTELAFAEDMEFWLRLARQGDFLGVFQPLTYIYLNSNSMQRSGSKLHQAVKEFNARNLILSRYADYAEPVAKLLLDAISKAILYGYFNPTLIRKLTIDLRENDAAKIIYLKKIWASWYLLRRLIRLALIELRSLILKRGV